MKTETPLSVAQQSHSLFYYDPVTSAEYFDSIRRTYPLDSEKRLMLAVLEDAVECYQKYLLARGGKDKALFEEAEEWIWERNERSLFSFENICDALGLVPAWVRAGLLRRKEDLLTRRHGPKPTGAGAAKITQRPRRKGRQAA